MKPRRNAQYKTGDQALTKRVSLVDELSAFEEFREKILPAIQQDLARGLTVPQLREKYKALVEARKLTIALDPNTDPSVALAAAKDLTDRTEGKATEKKEIKHKFDNLKDAELDALLLSEADDFNASLLPPSDLIC